MLGFSWKNYEEITRTDITTDVIAINFESRSELYIVNNLSQCIAKKFFKWKDLINNLRNNFKVKKLKEQQNIYIYI